jgi:hypothetical protein
VCSSDLEGRRQGGGRFLLGYVSRSAALDRGVLAAAAGAGWFGAEMPGTRTATPCGTMEGWVLNFRLVGEGGKYGAARE